MVFYLVLCVLDKVLNAKSVSTIVINMLLHQLGVGSFLPFSEIQFGDATVNHSLDSSVGRALD